MKISGAFMTGALCFVLPSAPFALAQSVPPRIHYHSSVQGQPAQTPSKRVHASQGGENQKDIVDGLLKAKVSQALSPNSLKELQALSATLGNAQPQSTPPSQSSPDAGSLLSSFLQTDAYKNMSASTKTELSNLSKTLAGQATTGSLEIVLRLTGNGENGGLATFPLSVTFTIAGADRVAIMLPALVQPIQVTKGGKSEVDVTVDQLRLGPYFVTATLANGDIVTVPSIVTAGQPATATFNASEQAKCGWLPTTGGADILKPVGSVATITLGCLTNFGAYNTNTGKNNFFQTDQAVSYFHQVKSIYNGAAGAATVSADLASLNFGNGMQVTATTNIQAGATTPTTAISGTVPTLAATSAAQATQNMLYGGTFLVSALYPLVGYGLNGLSNAGNFGLTMDVIGKEGIDIQNFKSSTSTSVTHPPSHSSAQLEGYITYNAIGQVSSSSGGGASSGLAGALFLGGSYGVAHTSHDYARDYGFGNAVNHQLGQLSGGITMNSVATIIVSRGFGPSQTYVDSTTNMPTYLRNNFKEWSVGIIYVQASK